MIVDGPGFGNNQSIEDDIANSLETFITVSKAMSVYPVFIINYKSIGYNCAEEFKHFIVFYLSRIKNLHANLPAMNFLFTHFDNLDIDMGSLI